MTVRQAAKRIGCHPRHVLHLISKGVLRAKQVERPGQVVSYRWEVNAKDVNHYATQPQQGGYPRGQKRPPN
jgi:excisionase family DNA binding protein